MFATIAGGADAPKSEIAATVQVGLEHDDNLLLSPGKTQEEDDEVLSDVLFRLRSDNSILIPWREHRASVNLRGDYRRGLSARFSDLNLALRSELNLKLSRGLSLEVSNGFQRNRFDQRLTEEAGTPDSNDRYLEISGEYVFVERLRAAAKWGQRSQKFLQPVAQRDIDFTQLDVYLPITRSVVTRFMYRSEQQTSAVQSFRNYSDDSHGLELEWRGPARFRCFAGLKRQTFDFTATEHLEDFRSTVVELGAEAELSEVMSTGFSVGRDVFGEPTYSAKASYRNEGRLRFELELNQQTRPSFSFLFDQQLVQKTALSFSTQKRLGSFWTASLGHSRIQHEFLVANAGGDDGGYRIDSSHLELSRSLGDRLEVQLRMSKSSRTASLDALTFDNQRIGVFATVRLYRGP